MQNARYALAMSALLAAVSAAAQVTPTPPPATTPPAPAPAAPAAPVVAATPALPTESVPYGPGMKVNISPDGSKYIRFITWHQVWARYTENNTGTLRAPGKPQSDQLDFALRRSRLIILSQLNPRFLVYTHIGVNNQTAVSGGVAPATDGKKPQLFVHEAVVEYKVNKYLNLGAGMHYQNGLSRMTRSSTINYLTLDAPLTNWPVIEAIDQFVRGIGVYGKGRVGKFDYVLSVNESFLTNQSGAFSTPLGLGTTTGTGTARVNTGSNTAQYNPQGTNHVYQGYFSYGFLESEANLLPFNVGTYLGSKRVLNIGAGFFYNKDGMYSRSSSSVLDATAIDAATAAGLNSLNTVATTKHDIALFSADVFFDTPINKESGTAFTLYGVYYNYNMGPNHTRFIGAANPGYGTDARRGNAVPHSGTGNVGYVQAGFLLPKNLLGPKLRVQPYASHLLAGYEGLRTSNGEQKNVNIFDAGANFYIDGHNAKFTLNYRARPDFTDINNVDYKPEITLQTQVAL
ncbi:hypothetical protein [Hymenobacter psychrotolerans]|uniref:Short chain amide porin n=1 Tax=Hymenobacter psychrotolerans DSM 18569 TaxID=1121959 RepID=A0A1M6SWJ1_9BACT|nr:hypothetical protein [Hymenobacter psychrotolerans]SHK49010.1 hypothetical protein SAMN02746009_01000 [Hymenobacter psychrotolerans DSM 18569]